MPADLSGASARTPAVLWWLRRDLRLSDNTALQTAVDVALQRGAALVPVFILDERLLRRPAAVRQAFLFAGLRALDHDLRALGSRLLVRRGLPEVALAAILRETGADIIFAEEDVAPFARRRDVAVAAVLPLHLLPGVSTHPTSAVRKADGSPYTIFTPYSRTWKALPLPLDALPAPQVLPPMLDLPGESLPDLPAPPDFPAGEREAKRRLDSFVDGPIYSYAETRNRVDLAGTSILSPYLRFGMLSARQAVAACLSTMETAPDASARRGCETWLNELIWREFYQSILLHYPYVAQTSFNPALRAVPWRDAPADLLAWQTGHTGYPIVDAAMRQLLQTGWMHNRARMINASFLVKDLLIDWREGERWFMQHLVDGDPAANNGGWQWTAGVGTDAAPFFRIFNPVLQSQKFDPQGLYIRRWLPELASVPDAYIHEPWKMLALGQQTSTSHLGVDYPLPIVDHSMARDRALAAYRHARNL